MAEKRTPHPDPVGTHYSVDRATASAALPRVIELPDTPAYDPRAAPKLPKTPVVAHVGDRPAASGSKRRRTVRVPQPESPDRPDRPAPTDERTAAWFAALLPGETAETPPAIVGAHDGTGAALEERPSVDTFARLLRGRSERFKGLKVVLEHDDGRRVHVHIE
jgi:hypothetical protein